MGTVIPLYGYVNPCADEAPKRGLIARRNVLVASVDRLLDYVSRNDVKDQQQRVMWGDDFDPCTDAWTHHAIYERDRDTRPVLHGLLQNINTDASIVVPTLEDITYPPSETTLTLIDKILHAGVPVISMDWKTEGGGTLLQFAGDRAATLLVFQYMWQNAMTVERRLRAFAINKDSILRAYNEGVLPNNGIGHAL